MTFLKITLKSNKRLVPCRLEPPFPVRIVKFNWVELFTLWRLIDSMQVLPRALLTKLRQVQTKYAVHSTTPRVVFLLHPSLGIHLKKRIDVGSEPFSFNFSGCHLCTAQGSSQRGLNSIRDPSSPHPPTPPPSLRLKPGRGKKYSVLAWPEQPRHDINILLPLGQPKEEPFHSYSVSPHLP
jgi:hypothetical protein